MSKSLFKFDERAVSVIKNICTIMYLITILMLMTILFYRQFVLGQTTDQFSDIANILVFNIIVLIAAVLYLGGITIPRIKIRNIVLLYLGFVIIGFLFTLFKYAVLIGQPLTFTQSLVKLGIILVICAFLLFIYVLFAFLGHKKIEKDIS